MDPVEIRRRNLIADDAYPCASPSGLRFEALSHHACLDKLLAMMDYDALRAEQAALRARGVHRGIGLASFIEITNPGAALLWRRRRPHLGAGRGHGAARRARAR